jgi:hypothetical protein
VYTAAHRLTGQELVRPSAAATAVSTAANKKDAVRPRSSSRLGIAECDGLLQHSKGLLPASTQSTPLVLLLLADALLVKPVRASLHSLYMRLLVDAAFKQGFALAFGRGYRLEIVLLYYTYIHVIV